MLEYTIETGNLQVMKEKLNTLRKESWKPILMSTTTTAPPLITVILEREEPAKLKYDGEVKTVP